MGKTLQKILGTGLVLLGLSNISYANNQENTKYENQAKKNSGAIVIIATTMAASYLILDSDDTYLPDKRDNFL